MFYFIIDSRAKLTNICRQYVRQFVKQTTIVHDACTEDYKRWSKLFLYFAFSSYQVSFMCFYPLWKLEYLFYVLYTFSFMIVFQIARLLQIHPNSKEKKGYAKFSYCFSKLFEYHIIYSNLWYFNKFSMVDHFFQSVRPFEESMWAIRNTRLKSIVIFYIDPREQKTAPGYCRNFSNLLFPSPPYFAFPWIFRFFLKWRNNISRQNTVQIFSYLKTLTVHKAINTRHTEAVNIKCFQLPHPQNNHVKKYFKHDSFATKMSINVYYATIYATNVYYATYQI